MDGWLDVSGQVRTRYGHLLQIDDRNAQEGMVNADRREETNGKATVEVDGECKRRYGTGKTKARKFKGSDTLAKENTEAPTFQPSWKGRKKMMMGVMASVVETVLVVVV